MKAATSSNVKIFTRFYDMLCTISILFVVIRLTLLLLLIMMATSSVQLAHDLRLARLIGVEFLQQLLDIRLVLVHCRHRTQRLVQVGQLAFVEFEQRLYQLVE